MFRSIIDTVGRTPLVELRRISAGLPARIAAKVAAFEAFICLSRSLTGDRVLDSALAARYYQRLLVVFPRLDSVVLRFAPLSTAALVEVANTDRTALECFKAIASIWLTSRSAAAGLRGSDDVATIAEGCERRRALWQHNPHR